MAGDWDGVHYPDDLTIPFCFIPDGAPEPTEWLARYPDHIRMPATFIPDPPRHSEAPPPPDPVAAASASVATPARLSEWTTPELVAMEVGEFLAQLALVLTFLEIMRPTATASREMDERPSAFVPPAPIPAPPGLTPPDTTAKPGEGGFTPALAAAPFPGFMPAAPGSKGLPGDAAQEKAATVFHQNRNDGLEGGARTNSERARKAAEAADPEVTRALQGAEWEAHPHHLINIAGLRDAPNLIQEAVRGGWRTDDQGNLAPLPASPEAQRKLKARGINRPVHDSAHRNWNTEVGVGYGKFNST